MVFLVTYVEKYELWKLKWLQDFDGCEIVIITGINKMQGSDSNVLACARRPYLLDAS